VVINTSGELRKKHALSKRSAVFLGILIGLSTVLAYCVLRTSNPTIKKNPFLQFFILFDGLLSCFFLCAITTRIKDLYNEKKKEEKGAKFHLTIVSIFSLVTIVPIIILSIFSVTFFNLGVSIWFSQPIQTTINDANTVAELYLKEHMKNIRIDAVVMRDRINNLCCEYDLFSRQDFLKIKTKIKEELDTFVEDQNLEEVFVLCVDRQTQEKAYIGSSLALSLAFAVEETAEDEMNEAAKGEPIIKQRHGTMQALAHLGTRLQAADFYIWISKNIDQNILKYVEKAKDSTMYYKESFKSQRYFQFSLLILFGMTSLLLLLAAILFAMYLADVLIRPILQLIKAADNVSQGDLSVRVPETKTLKDLNRLEKAFNRMTERLEKQNRELIVSEKKAAWSDIARKIAHEVKNPLTPIQLAAERLKRKYRLEIRSDPATFTKCIDTIIRQVSHIENLINEFSNFARMPEAVMASVDLIPLFREIIFMQRQATPHIQIQFKAQQSSLFWECDSQQITQVIFNLLQNSINAITENPTANAPGQIVIIMQETSQGLWICLEDNGIGFPVYGRERLFEPYYTTREKGTGLGMAIVSRIISEHSGSLFLKDAQGHQGARVEIVLPRVHPH
jgi:two-component system nitrogen regulation sensor histidine kinase NtrY